MDIQNIMSTIESCHFRLSRPSPRLLFGPEEVRQVRQRAAQRGDYQSRLRQQCDQLLSTPAEDASNIQVRIPSSEAVTMAEGTALLATDQYVDWLKTRLDALCALDTWMAPVHRNPLCDHVMTNVAAHIAYAVDLLGDDVSEDGSARVAQGMRRLFFDPYLAATRERAEAWAKERVESNRKMMCYGEAGFATCAFVGQWPEAREALALSARGVIETLDLVPPEGDWPEGVPYWFGTLFMGLRFAAALRRLTAGAVDLFQHEALQVTGDYAMMLTSPAGRNFDFNDNGYDLSKGYPAEGVLLLARETGRRDWLATARHYPCDTLLWLVLDDPDIPSQHATRRTALFPRTGIATMRNGWERDDTFIGFKCGPSDVGHCHLDANSFILESGGVRLLIDEGVLGQAHFIGFFEHPYRWNWDHLATIGHNTLLIDGKGQTYGPEYPGRIVKLEEGDGWHLAVGDASLCYPDTLTKFVRTILFMPPDTVLIRDVVECQGERHAEWLLHALGSVSSQDYVTIVENEGVTLTVTPFLPDRSFGWRVSDVVRTSIYENSDTRKTEVRPIRYRSFAPFRAAEQFEFLFGLHVGSAGPEEVWSWEGQAGDWELKVAGPDGIIVPDGDSLAVAER